MAPEWVKFGVEEVPTAALALDSRSMVHWVRENCGRDLAAKAKQSSCFPVTFEYPWSNEKIAKWPVSARSQLQKYRQ